MQLNMVSGLRLFIEPLNQEFFQLYHRAADAWNQTPPDQRNSGFDLHCDAGYIEYHNAGGSVLVGMGCRALAVDTAGRPRAFWLAPRSSICKTKWRLANSMGLIDATYRGVIRGAFSSIDASDRQFGPDNHQNRYVQLAAADLMPWSEVIVVDQLPGHETIRGLGGFGSTGS
jgi:dUTPase